MVERLNIHPPQITFSHGGGGELPSYPAVPGNSVSAGNPIEVWRGAAGGLNWPMFLLLSTGTLSVKVEGNIGPQLGDGSLDPTSWFDFSSGGYNMTAGTSQSIAVPPMFGWVRSRITAYTTGTLISGVGPIPLRDGVVIKAQYPTLKAGGTG